MVAATAPGTTVPMKVIREGKERTFNVRVEELNLETETTSPGRCRRRRRRRYGRRLRHHAEQRDAGDCAAVRAAGQHTGAVVTDVDPDSPAARVLQPGDVILQVNRASRWRTANEASAALRAVPSGRAVGMLIMRRGQEQFVTVRKQ